MHQVYAHKLGNIHVTKVLQGATRHRSLLLEIVELIKPRLLGATGISPTTYLGSHLPVRIQTHLVSSMFEGRYAKTPAK